ncbi:MAG TPA: hypothetical protein PLQ11_04400 [Beijerinckiaceae bacterium]|nr:hypothetical protein [Beijerinckiaceae bacterium]
MSNQLHGKKFEDLLKGCGLFSGAADSKRSPISGFDIEEKFDRLLGIPTSIKATGTNTVSLSDARKFWSINHPFRMLIGVYVQDGVHKKFVRVEEILVHGCMFAGLRGNISAAAVAELHEGIGLAAFDHGEEEEARDWFREVHAKVLHNLGLVRLNPKIDSKGQRRLQCSVPLDSLVALAKKMPDFVGQSGQPAPTYRCHAEEIGDLGLPITLKSGRRVFNP